MSKTDKLSSHKPRLKERPATSEPPVRQEHIARRPEQQRQWSRLEIPPDGPPGILEAVIGYLEYLQGKLPIVAWRRKPLNLDSTLNAWDGALEGDLKRMSSIYGAGLSDQ